MRVKLKDVCEKATSNLKQSDILSIGGTYPVYGASGYLGNIDSYHQDKPYIAVVKDGAGIGRTAILPPKSSVIGTMQYLIPKENVMPEYLYYVVKHMRLQKYYTGATIPHIYFKDYQNEEFNLADSIRQREIVKVLKNVEDTIRYQEIEINKFDELIKARFIEMFGDPIRNPYGWYNDCLNNVCTKINDGTHCSPESFDKGDYMYITAKNIKQNGLDLSNVTYVSEKVHKPIYQRCNPEFGDILYIKDGATTGIATINTMKNEFTLLSSVALLKYDRSLINGYYLIHLLNSKEMYSKIRKNMGGAAITRLTIAKIKEIKVIVPPIDLQNQFADFVRQVDKSREEVKKSLEKTQQLYDSLMQEYFG